MSWRKFYVDLVDGPERGRRIELAWGQKNFFVMPEVELPYSLEPPSEVMPNIAHPIKYCAMEYGRIQEGQAEMGLYRVEQWSVDGKSDEYDRLFWQRVAAMQREIF